MCQYSAKPIPYRTGHQPVRVQVQVQKTLVSTLMKLLTWITHPSPFHHEIPRLCLPNQNDCIELFLQVQLNIIACQRQLESASHVKHFMIHGKN